MVNQIMEKITEKLRKSRKIAEYKHISEQDRAKIRLDNIALSAFAYTEKCLFENNKFVFLAQNEFRAKKALQDFSAVYNEDKIIFFPENEYMLYDISARSTDIHAERMRCLYRILEGNWTGIIITPAALAQWLPDPDVIRDKKIVIKTAENMDLRLLYKSFADINYKKVPTVDGMGQFAVRGDIVDVFPYGEENPYRIEFFDDEIDTIRVFDVVSQRTIRRVEEISIFPDNECTVWSDEHAQKVKENIKKELEKYEKRSSIYNRLQKDIEKIEKYKTFEGYDRYIPYIIDNEF